MSNLQVFQNNEFGEIRTILKDKQLWFIGKDVADILKYQNGSRDINRHVDEEDRETISLFDGTQNRSTIIINESGLYSLVLSSKLPQAKKFKRWVTTEVLPSIRRNGAYMTDDVIEKALTSPDFLIQLATNLKEEKEKRILAEQKVEEQKPKVLFADAVSVAHTSILVGDLAKLIKQNGVDIGANRLFQWLRKEGYLIKRKGTDYNMPTQYSMDLGLFEVKETSITHSDGHISISKTPKVTGKGQLYFVNKFISNLTREEVACTK